MTAGMSLEHIVALLRAPLAGDGGRTPDLGARLRDAADLLCRARLPPERVGPVRAWRQRLGGFERMSEHEQRVQLALGLRLCAGLVGVPGVVVPRVAVAEPATAAAGAPPESPLDEPVTSLPGIGPALARRLAERRLETVEDLAWFVPRRYDDLRNVVSVEEAAAAPPGTRVTFVARVRRSRSVGRYRRFVVVHLGGELGGELDGEGGRGLTARWFNVHRSMAQRFVVGRRVVLSGILRERDGELGVVNPEVLGDPDDDSAGVRAHVVPRYLDVEGVAPAVLRKSCRAAVARAGPHLVDGVPAAVARALGLPGLAEALARLHEPPADLSAEATAALGEGESPWHRRLAFDELFFLGLAVARRRAERRAVPAPSCVGPLPAPSVFPFALTGAQRRAIEQIAADLGAERPMNRLLQGDVGAGKTAVAFAAAHVAMAAGRQVALMAPTELLAEQHLSTLGPWAGACGRRVALLTASTPRAVRESTLGMLAAGAVDLLVGTHALLAERVGFADLGLVIIDEQHRFGVAQRVRLRVGSGERERLPHLLVMTATPIPRSLALTIYGDLDVTLLDEQPPGRAPPATRVLAGARGRASALALLRRQLGQGARAFVVCPLVAPSEEADWADATTTAAELAEELAPYRVGLVHGRMPSAQRDAAMAALRANALDVLVATTVIEVGVDVPAATVMVVLDADRFGLAQLHQLRGRVGRGGGAAHCLLLTRGGRTSDAVRRLAVMEAESDGFKIAEEDLAIRGPGEILGVRQAGLPKLRFGDLVKHAALAADARRAAEGVLAADPALERAEHAVTARVLAARVGKAVSAEGG
jgi:ATP-dependent DNA helicase RecG